MKKSIVLLILVMLLAGCAVSSGTPAPAVSTTARFPLTITDDLGRAVTIDKEPQRLVSLAPSNTEIVFALGMGSRLAGVTTYCNYPDEVKTIPKVGGYSTADLEKIVAINPDLVLATRAHQKEVVPAMEKLGLKVIALVPVDLDGLYNSIRLVGRATGRDTSAEVLAASTADRIKRVTEKTGKLASSQRPSVLYLNWVDPFKTAGKGTFVDDLLARAGGGNVAGNIAGYNTITLESIVAADPQVILVSGMGTARHQMYDAVLADKRLAVTSACRTGRVYEIDSDLVDRPGPRLADGLESIFHFIQPGL